MIHFIRLSVKDSSQGCNLCEVRDVLIEIALNENNLTTIYGHLFDCLVLSADASFLSPPKKVSVQLLPI